ncbi:GNAT family N-acetyltransferase [Clostridium estertheticum]|uniref:GNAT family N-acetyltransferase n=1 Tax=Clostridium estertheticum TaxID=238834 RepID=UPI001C0D5101|nr:GNAT family N-acetyltransferase [Clostridium estertheticum]MBU3076074.1 GNAT family N-acetyltransferase [Clostridium estertheticum]MBU3166201.1 GNAT family N-acetyltransferase [Clostridium estertheticum]
MDFIKGKKKDLSGILDIISNCIKHMESQSIYQWNEFYPNSDIIENDIKSEHCYVLKDNGKYIAYVAINEEQSPEYSKINWSTDGIKVLVIHRLSVHPESQGKGIAKKMLKFIEDVAAVNNYSCIRLDAYSGNETALKLYENFGYKKVGQLYFPWRDIPFNCYEKNINSFLLCY